MSDHGNSTNRGLAVNRRGEKTNAALAARAKPAAKRTGATTAKPKPKAATPRKPKAVATKPTAKATTPRTPGGKRAAEARAARLKKPFTFDAIHPALAAAQTRPALEAAWRSAMEQGNAPIFDGVGRTMELDQARNALSSVMYLTEALPWLREVIGRVAPANEPNVRAAIKGRSIRAKGGKTQMYATRTAGSIRSVRHGETWIVMNAPTYKAAEYARVSAQSSRPWTPESGRALTRKDILAGRTLDGTSWWAVGGPVAASVAHEVGHGIHQSIAPFLGERGEYNPDHYRLTTPAQEALGQFARNFRLYFQDRSYRSASHLSQYAKTNWKEAFAEATAALTYGTPEQRSQPIVLEVARIINLAHPNSFKMPAAPRASTSAKKTTASTTAKATAS